MTSHGAASPQDIVELYLRGQNLEQVKMIDEAVSLYEQALTARFDAAGPYDRLIAIYRVREEYEALERVAAAAVEHVRTFDDKRSWYASVRDDARAAAAALPDRSGAEF